MNRYWKTAVFAALGLFLYSRLAGNVILYYINQRFVSLTLLAAIGMLLLGFSYWLRSDGDAGHEDHDHDHEREAPAHGHSHGALGWFGLFILVLPVVLGWLVPPRPLGAAALGNREINVGGLSSISAPRTTDRMGLVRGERNILDWLADFQASGDATSFRGQEAHIIGFVYRDERFEPGTFMIARYVLSCCVADANPVGLIVRWPDARELAVDQWVEVRGRFEVGQFDGLNVPVLAVDTLTPTDPPAQPYLYQ